MNIKIIFWPLLVKLGNFAIVMLVIYVNLADYFSYRIFPNEKIVFWLLILMFCILIYYDIRVLALLKISGGTISIFRGYKWEEIKNDKIDIAKYSFLTHALSIRIKNINMLGKIVIPIFNENALSISEYLNNLSKNTAP